jgi:hypothetical protein
MDCDNRIRDGDKAEVMRNRDMGFALVHSAATIRLSKKARGKNHNVPLWRVESVSGGMREMYMLHALAGTV